MNEIIKMLYERKSMRLFEEKSVGYEMKKELLHCAMQAPTAGNQQLYTILDITDESVKSNLAELCDHQKFINKAPIVFVFLADCKKWYDAYLSIGETPRSPGVGDLLLAVSDATIASANVVMAAESFGLGSCYIGDVMEHHDEMVKLLNLPKYVFPCCMLVIGYPQKKQYERTKPQRADIKYIVHENAYRAIDDADLREMFDDKKGILEYQEWLKQFMNRKYNSKFSREMTNSVEKYLKSFE